jgi:hypothetical protein
MAKKRQSFSTRKVISATFNAKDKQALRALKAEEKNPKKVEEKTETAA